ncbi:hypothetical protein QQS21_005244 [Conoideocrella luteorostrata]|uniref:Uncharacterized protein n=1 Tax=Conoideocrella luteorostrata TaxID=1105319 RepID=A0AAJ0CPS5_9HYPO|nr:hypothetical protein QQS21_005244 [Conoideocrella luteorostrata]
MAIVQPNWSYWACIFPAMLTNSIGGDTLYSISNLIITSLFPSRTQGVAGGVYNTIAQIGKSFGLTITAVITNAVTARSDTAGMKNPAASLEGYRAGFWYCFSLNAAAMLSILWGLRKVGKVGAKGD